MAKAGERCDVEALDLSPEAIANWPSSSASVASALRRTASIGNVQVLTLVLFHGNILLRERMINSELVSEYPSGATENDCELRDN